MDIRIILCDGTLWKINMNEQSNIINIKESISCLTKIPPQNFNLFFRGEELKNEKSLKDVGIIANDLIECVITNENKKNIIENETKGSCIYNNDSVHQDPPQFNNMVNFLINMGFKENQVKFVLRHNKYDIKTSALILKHEKFVYPRVDAIEEEEEEEEMEEDDSYFNEKGPHWEEYENKLLIKKFQKYGNDWDVMKKYFPYRTTEDIEWHWHHHLRKKVVTCDLLGMKDEEGHSKQKKWTKKDDEILFALWKVIGNNWDELSKHFDNRKPDHVYRHWATKLQPKLIMRGLIKNDYVVNVDDMLDDEAAEQKETQQEHSPNELISSEFRHRKFDPTASSDREEDSSSDEGVAWTYEMDKKLKGEYKIHGKKWGVIIEQFPGLKISDIQKRWSEIENDLDDNDVDDYIPAVQRHKIDDGQKITWSNEENELFIQKLLEMGQNWVEMLQFFPDKKKKNLSCHYRLHIKKKLTNEQIEKIESIFVPEVKKPLPSSNRQWTTQDDTLLIEKVKELGPKFGIIKEFFPGRSKNSLSSHYYQITKKDVSKSTSREVLSSEDDDYKDNVNSSLKNRWTSKEDELLIEKHAEENGHWDRISEFFPNRTKVAIVNHWQTVIKKKLGKTPMGSGNERNVHNTSVDGRKGKPNKWTSEEDAIIINLWRRLGPNWKEIQKHIPNRTINSISSHWYTIWKPKLFPYEVREIEDKYRKGKLAQTYDDIPEEDRKNLTFIEEHYPEDVWTLEEEVMLSKKIEEVGKNWSEIAELFPEKLPFQIQNHWKLMKSQNPNNLADLNSSVSQDETTVTTDDDENKRTEKIPAIVKPVEPIPIPTPIIKNTAKPTREFKLPSISDVSIPAKVEVIKPTKVEVITRPINKNILVLPQINKTVQKIPENNQSTNIQPEKKVLAHFSSDDEMKMMESYKSYGLNFNKMAEFIPGKSIEELVEYWNQVMTKKFHVVLDILEMQKQEKIIKQTQTPQSVTWNEENDKILFRVFVECKENIGNVCMFYPGINPKFIEERCRYLKEISLNNFIRQWTPEEDRILISQLSKQDSNLESIAKLLPNKSIEMIKFRLRMITQPTPMNKNM